jgi:hypothetical protein
MYLLLFLFISLGKRVLGSVSSDCSNFQLIPGFEEYAVNHVEIATKGYTANQSWTFCSDNIYPNSIPMTIVMPSVYNFLCGSTISDLWIGLYQQNNSGAVNQGWLWLDNESVTNRPVSWADNNPRSSGDRCAKMLCPDSKGIQSEDCSKNHAILCQVKGKMIS